MRIPVKPTVSKPDKHDIETVLTLEQHPPKIKPSIPPTASHAGIVSMNILPTRAIIFFEAGL
jgi:hypothetical protein